MRQNNVELLIWIKGCKNAFEYKSPKDFNTYVEGRDGSEFEIEVRNHNPFRIEAIVSVDGLSVTTGEEAGEKSYGYVVDAHGSVRIPGWKRGNQTAAAFTFTGRKGGSYVEQTTGEPTNKGVIGLMAYKEKVEHRPLAFRGGLHGGNFENVRLGGPSTGDYIDHSHYSWSSFGGGYRGDQSKGGSDDRARGIAPTTFNAMSNASLTASNTSLSGSLSDTNKAFFSTEPVEQTLGTGYGSETDFHTTKVEFKRAGMLVVMALYYDDRRGLEKRGIEMTRTSRTRYETTPNPFPQMQDDGCPAPPNWRG